MDVAHLTNSFFDQEYIFIVREDSLIPVGGGTFFGSLFLRIAGPRSWAFMAVIFVVYVVLITVGQRIGQRQPTQIAGSSCFPAGLVWSTYFFNTAFKLLAVATGQGKTASLHQISEFDVMNLSAMCSLSSMLPQTGRCSVYFQTMSTWIELHVSPLQDPLSVSMRYGSCGRQSF